jgi:hypothetical protein
MPDVICSRCSSVTRSKPAAASSGTRSVTGLSRSASTPSSRAAPIRSDRNDFDIEKARVGVAAS